MSTGRTPLWIAFLTGWLLVRATAGLRAERACPALSDYVQPSSNPASMSTRELRRLPGLGERRAQAVFEARRMQRDRGRSLALLSWSDVHGIGPRTEARLNAWMRDPLRD